jgi:hypothetical protein
MGILDNLPTLADQGRCAQQKGDLEPRAITKAKRRAADEAALEAAYAEVDLRDGSICWVTGRYAVAGAPDRRVRREHHHLRGRNCAPEWVTDPDRIITVVKEVHDLITSGHLIVEGDDARKPIRFHWREDVPATSRIFRIKSRRWSANE